MAEQSFLQTCKSCDHEFRAPLRLAGRKVRCSFCGKVLTLSTPDAEKPADPLVGKVIRGCELRRRLGAGTMGAVYEAHYIKGQRTVAVKLLSSKGARRPDLVKRFQREARLCKNIDHPNVIKVYDMGEDNGAHYMVMDYIDGRCMATMIEDQGKVSWKEAALMMRKLAEALARAHELEIIHRDIKPANILLRSDGEPILADLGLGKQLSNDDDYGLTLQGTAMGTPAYMAPEQITDASNATPAADVYGLGATFYHLIAGQRPYEAPTSAEILTKLKNEEPPELKDLVPDIPQGFNDLIMQMIEKNPEDRPAHPSILIKEIDATLAAPSQARQRRRRNAARRQPQHRKSSNGPLIMAVVALIVAVGALIWYLQQSGQI